MLDNEHLKEAFLNTVNGSKSSLDLFKHLLEKSGCFRQGIAKDERAEIYNRGYGDFGLYLRELFLAYAPEKYIEIIRKSVEESEEQQ